MYKNLIEFTYNEAMIEINLIAPNGCDSQVIVNALCAFMKQIGDLRQQAMEQQKIEGINGGEVHPENAHEEGCAS